MIYAHVFNPEQKEPLDKLIDGIRNLTELPKEETMICNRCIKSDVCTYKDSTEDIEKRLKTYDGRFKNIEIDCRHREAATQAQIDKMREQNNY